VPTHLRFGAGVRDLSYKERESVSTDFVVLRREFIPAGTPHGIWPPGGIARHPRGEVWHAGMGRAEMGRAGLKSLLNTKKSSGLRAGIRWCPSPQRTDLRNDIR